MAQTVKTMNDVLDSLADFYARTHIKDAVELYNAWRRQHYNLVTDNEERGVIFDFCCTLVKMDTDVISEAVG